MLGRVRASPASERRLRLTSGVAGDRAQPVVAEVVGGQAGVAQFLLDDGAGGVAEPVRVQLGDLVLAPRRSHTSSAPRTDGRRPARPGE